PDLAQRTLALSLPPIEEHQRRGEDDLLREFEAELPQILRGLLDLISEVLVHLPSVEVSSPERMFAFSRWLAAMELAGGVPDGTYQRAYSATLSAGMLESLTENPLAAVILTFAESE